MKSHSYLILHLSNGCLWFLWILSRYTKWYMYSRSDGVHIKQHHDHHHKRNWEHSVFNPHPYHHVGNRRTVWWCAGDRETSFVCVSRSLLLACCCCHQMHNLLFSKFSKFSWLYFKHLGHTYSNRGINLNFQNSYSTHFLHLNSEERQDLECGKEESSSLRWKN